MAFSYLSCFSLQQYNLARTLDDHQYNDMCGLTYVNDYEWILCATGTPKIKFPEPKFEQYKIQNPN